MCSWNEPELSRVAGVPDCVVTGRADPSLRRPLFSGSLVRVSALWGRLPALPNH